jgi:N-acetylneuraminate synthase
MKVPAYNSLPEQVDVWFKAFKKAKEMCGAPGTAKKNPLDKEVKYLDKLVRGVYAKRDLPKGHVISDADVYLAVPLLHGQISCRELMKGEILLSEVKADKPIGIEQIDSPYAHNEELKKMINSRGLDPKADPGKDFNHGDQAVANIATLARNTH